jgi:hypothetical protein
VKLLDKKVLREKFVSKQERIRGGWKKCIKGGFMICALTSSFSVDWIKKYKADGACSTCGGRG